MIDSGSSTNLVARRVVQDLLLLTKLFAQPYQLAWITSGQEVNVFERCLVHFFVGAYYRDYVWCDLIPSMTACRLMAIWARSDSRWRRQFIHYPRRKSGSDHISKSCKWNWMGSKPKCARQWGSRKHR